MPPPVVGNVKLLAALPSRSIGVIGVVGGMGPAATNAFLTSLTAMTEAARDQDHVHVLVDSDPSIADRTAFLLGRGPDPRPGLIRAAGKLVGMGAELLVIPCNTANVFAQEVSEATHCEVIDWLGLTADHVAEWCPGGRVALLATAGTVQAGVMQQALEERGVATVLPDEEQQHLLMDLIYGEQGIKRGLAGGGQVDELLTVARAVARERADAILLGCTELPLLLPANDARWPVPVFDPAMVVARQLLGRAGVTVREVTS